jgi:hypothetical protein
VLTIAPVAYFLYFQVSQQQIRRQMKDKLELSEARVLHLRSSDIHWIREEKELSINDKLFDVRSLKVEANGDITVSGLFDDAETLLVDRLEKNQENNNDPGGKQLTKFFQLLLIVPFSKTEQTALRSPSKIVHPCFNDTKIASIFKAILTPPPQA